MSETTVRGVFSVPIIDVESARQRLTREQCPRRYCWYWHSLSFDWGMSPAEGCQVPQHFIGDSRLRRAGVDIEPWVECCRATDNPQHADYYEPREPHLQEDGWPKDFFLIVGKLARQRRYQRREKGKQRKSKRLADS